ncbi:MAG: hypothetical protein V4702_03280 [Patescibacteria group bacterium]
MPTLIPVLESGPSCGRCDLNFEGRCMGWAALEAVADVNEAFDDVSGLDHLGSSRVVTERMLGESIAQGRGTTALSSDLENTEAGLRLCKGAVVKPLLDSYLKVSDSFTPDLPDAPRIYADSAKRVFRVARNIRAAASFVFDHSETRAEIDAEISSIEKL